MFEAPMADHATRISDHLEDIWMLPGTSSMISVSFERADSVSLGSPSMRAAHAESRYSRIAR
eukprot:3229685-Pleurochrysis_carterae.AAC.1